MRLKREPVGENWMVGEWNRKSADRVWVFVQYRGYLLIYTVLIVEYLHWKENGSTGSEYSFCEKYKLKTSSRFLTYKDVFFNVIFKKFPFRSEQNVLFKWDKCERKKIFALIWRIGRGVNSMEQSSMINWQLCINLVVIPVLDEEKLHKFEFAI